MPEIEATPPAEKEVEEMQGHKDGVPSSKQEDTDHDPEQDNTEHGSTLEGTEHGSRLDGTEHGSRLEGTEHGSRLEGTEHGSRLEGTEHGSRLEGTEHGSRLEGTEHGSRLEGAEHGSRLEGTEHGSRLEGTEHGSRLEGTEHGSRLEGTEHGSRLEGTEHGSRLEGAEHVEGKNDPKYPDKVEACNDHVPLLQGTYGSTILGQINENLDTHEIHAVGRVSDPIPRELDDPAVVNRTTPLMSDERTTGGHIASVAAPDGEPAEAAVLLTPSNATTLPTQVLTPLEGAVETSGPGLVGPGQNQVGPITMLDSGVPSVLEERTTSSTVHVTGSTVLQNHVVMATTLMDVVATEHLSSLAAAPIIPFQAADIRLQSPLEGIGVFLFVVFLNLFLPFPLSPLPSPSLPPFPLLPFPLPPLPSPSLPSLSLPFPLPPFSLPPLPSHSPSLSLPFPLPPPSLSLPPFPLPPLPSPSPSLSLFIPSYLH